MLKKRFFGLLVLIAGLMLMFTMNGCGDKGSGDPTSPGGGGNGPFTIEFATNGGVTIPGGLITTDNQTVEKGGKAAEPSLMANPNHEDFNGWYTNSSFNGSPYNFNTTVTSNLKLYAKWGYKIGDTGPAGGKIFYVKSGASYPNWKYLEASPAELGKCRWAWGSFESGATEWLAYDYIVEGAKGTAIGTGRSNTDAILAMLSFTPYPSAELVTVPAAKGAEDYTAGSYGDWFLPSKDELNALYQSKVLSAPSGEVYYWSSSQHDDPNRNQCAWAQSFGTDDPGLQTEEAKNLATRTFVRPIRSFFCSH